MQHEEVGRVTSLHTTFGTMRAIQELPKHKRPLHVGFDFRSEFADPIRKGDLLAVIAQDPYMMGYSPVKEIVKLEQHKKIEKRTKTPVFTVNSANIDTPEIKERLKIYFEQHEK